MSRGGKRTPGIDPETGKPKKMGRPKAERLSNPTVAAKVLRDVKHELILKSLVMIELNRLGIDLTKENFGVSDAAKNVSIIPLTNLLHRLECRAFGNPMVTVNHLHDKPQDLNVTLTLGEGMKEAMKKAEARLLEFHRPA